MLHVFSLFCFLFVAYPSLTFAETTLYQVDLIVFTHTDTARAQWEHTPPTLSALEINHAIPLQARDAVAAKKTYHLMPQGLSSLSNAWNKLNQQPQYHALLHYTWLQPSNNQRPVFLSTRLNNGWVVEGTLRVRQSNYYLLDTNLRFSTPNQKQPAFILAQKQRLKPGNTYYLDHPQAGILIQVHRVT